jgi:cyclophilin family peptidyl-prolyl cis-trans isomerase
MNATTAQYCYIDFDINEYRQHLYNASCFVAATNMKYGWSSSQLLELSGSELSRIVQDEIIVNDHEWSTHVHTIQFKPPLHGNRILFQLFWDVAPMACENFATLCYYGSQSDITYTTTSIMGDTTATNKKKSKSNNNNNNISNKPPIGESGKPMTYKNSIIHRIVSQFIVQGGDFIFGNGTGGESIFHNKFKDEKMGLQLKHNQRGTLSMGNSGKNSNTSQFFITLNNSTNHSLLQQCDGKHVIFGKMISGWEVLDDIEAIGTASGVPNGTVTITDCGIYVPHVTPASGFWYDQPDKNETSYTGISSSFIVRPRVVVIGPSSSVVEKFDTVLQSKCCSVIKFITTLSEIEKTTPKEPTTATTTETTENILQKVYHLLESYAIDVVLIAPACRNIIEQIVVPESFCVTIEQQQEPSTINISKCNVILECKPLDAIRTVYTQSWLHQYHLNGIWKFDAI